MPFSINSLTRSTIPISASLLFVTLLTIGCQSQASLQHPNVASEPNRAQRLSLDSPWTATNGESGWTFDVAAALESEPDYAGSDDSSVEAGPFTRALYEDTRGHRYFVNIGELGAWWKLGDQWALGTIFEFEPGRDNTNDALTGFEEVEDTVEGQISLARRVGDWTLAGVLQPDALGRGKGFVAFLAAGYDRMWTDRLRFGASADISTGSAEYMMTEFGVSASESSASGLREFNPGAGLKSATLDLGLEYFFQPGLSLFTGVSAEYYFPGASDSPLIHDEGSDLTQEFGLGLRYSF